MDSMPPLLAAAAGEASNIYETLQQHPLLEQTQHEHPRYHDQAKVCDQVFLLETHDSQRNIHCLHTESETNSYALGFIGSLWRAGLALLSHSLLILVLRPEHLELTSFAKVAGWSTEIIDYIAVTPLASTGASTFTSNDRNLHGQHKIRDLIDLTYERQRLI